MFYIVSFPVIWLLLTPWIILQRLTAALARAFVAPGTLLTPGDPG